MSGHVTFGVLLLLLHCQDMSQFEHMHVVERAQKMLHWLPNFPNMSQHTAFLVL